MEIQDSWLTRIMTPGKLKALKKYKCRNVKKKRSFAFSHRFCTFTATVAAKYSQGPKVFPQLQKSTRPQCISPFVIQQAFRFTVGPGHCPMISKYGPSLSKAVGPVDPCFLVVKKSHFNKKIFILQRVYKLYKQKVHVGCQYCEASLKQPLKKRQKQRS